MSSGKAIAGLVLEIVRLVFIGVLPLSLPLSIVGTVLSAKSRRRLLTAGAPAGLAAAGLVCSVGALGICVLWLVGILIGLLIALAAGMF